MAEIGEKGSQNLKDSGNLLRSFFGFREKSFGSVDDEQGSAKQLKDEQGAKKALAEQALIYEEQLSTLRREFSEREQALVQELQASKQELLNQQLEQATKVGTLNNLVESLRQDVQTLRDAQQSLSRQHGLNLRDKQDEIDILQKAFAEVEFQLKAKMVLEQQAGFRLRHTLAEAQTVLEVIEPILDLSEQHARPETITAAYTLDELLSYNDRQFVLCAFQTLLGRSPDPEGLNYYLGRLRTGFSKIPILKQLRDSDEFFIHSNYQKYLGRLPDPENLDIHLNQLRSGVSKRNLVKQLRRSQEAAKFLRSKKGKVRSSILPGLDKAIRSYQRGQLPFIGLIIRLLQGTEGNYPTERKLRAIQNQLLIFGEDRNRYFNQLEASLAGFHLLVARRNQAIVEALEATNQASLDNPTTSFAKPKDTEGLRQLSPHVKKIYLQLKTSAAIHAARVA